MRPNQVDINVQGTDMFGARFLESAKLVSVVDSEISVFMWRPVAEGARVELNCNRGKLFFEGTNRKNYHTLDWRPNRASQNKLADFKTYP